MSTSQCGASWTTASGWHHSSFGSVSGVGKDCVTHVTCERYTKSVFANMFWNTDQLSNANTCTLVVSIQIWIYNISIFRYKNVFEPDPGCCNNNNNNIYL